MTLAGWILFVVKPLLAENGFIIMEKPENSKIHWKKAPFPQSIRPRKPGCFIIAAAP
jgi:hypothetical protein